MNCTDRLVAIFGSQAHIAKDDAAALGNRDIGCGDPGHGEVRLRRTTSQKKNGVPTRLVNTPSFNSGP